MRRARRRSDGVLAVELASRGIRVTHINPAAVDTEGARAIGAMSDEARAAHIARTLLLASCAVHDASVRRTDVVCCPPKHGVRAGRGEHLQHRFQPPRGRPPGRYAREGSQHDPISP